MHLSRQKQLYMHSGKQSSSGLATQAFPPGGQRIEERQSGISKRHASSDSQITNKPAVILSSIEWDC